MPVYSGPTYYGGTGSPTYYVPATMGSYYTGPAVTVGGYPDTTYSGPGVYPQSYPGNGHGKQGNGHGAPQKKDP